MTILDNSRGVLSPDRARPGEQPWISCLGSIYTRVQGYPLIVCLYYKASRSVQIRVGKLFLSTVPCENFSATAQSSLKMSTTVTETASPAANTGVTLRAYGGELENVKLLPSFTPDTPIEELRKRYEEEGVVWVRYLTLPGPLLIEG